MEKKIVKKFYFGLAYMKFAVVMEMPKNDRNTIDLRKFSQKINEQRLNVSASYSQSSYQNLKENLMEGWHPGSPTPIVCLRVKRYCKEFCVP